MKKLIILFIMILNLVIFSSCAPQNKEMNKISTSNNESTSHTTKGNTVNDFIVPPQLSESHDWETFYKRFKDDSLSQNEHTGKLDRKRMCLNYLDGYLGRYSSSGVYENFNYAIHDSGYVSIDKYNGVAIKVNIPEEIDGHKVAYIGEDCFRNQVLLKEVSLPDSIVLINTGAFFNCTNLQKVELPQSLLYIGSNAFASSGLTDLNMPDSVLAVDSYAFEGCKNLATVHLSKSLQYADGYIFSACKKLKNIEIPSTLDSICIGMFQGCERLTDVKVHQNIKSIESHSFVGCSSLKKIKLPKDVVFYEEYGAAFNSDVEIEYY